VFADAVNTNSGVCPILVLCSLFRLARGPIIAICRDRFAASATRVKTGWRVRFAALCIVMTLLEEMAVASRTTAAPWLRVEPSTARITVATSYLEAVATGVGAVVP